VGYSIIRLINKLISVKKMTQTVSIDRSIKAYSDLVIQQLCSDLKQLYGWSIGMLEHSFSRPFVPWNIRSLNCSFPGTFNPGTVRPGTFVPENE